LQLPTGNYEKDQDRLSCNSEFPENKIKQSSANDGGCHPGWIVFRAGCCVTQNDRASYPDLAGEGFTSTLWLFTFSGNWPDYYRPYCATFFWRPA